MSDPPEVETPQIVSQPSQIGPLQKIAGLQSIIPQFDGNTSVTPQYFLDNFEKFTTLVKCSEEEKLMFLKSKIRGDALAHLINSPDLSQENNYDRFKEKFLAFFEKKVSLATRQQKFSNCRMQAGETVKLYAARIALTTMDFFNNPDLSNPSVKALFEQCKLSKFLEGLLPDFKYATLMKDPQSFQDALDYVELLETNKACVPQSNQDISVMQSLNTVNAISKEISNQDIKKLIETHAQQTYDTICTLSKEIEDMRLLSHNNNPSRNRSNFAPPFIKGNRNNSTRPKNFPPCAICGKRNHLEQYCFYKRDTPRTPRFGQNSTQWNRNNDRGQCSGTSTRDISSRENPRFSRHLNYKRGGGN